VIKKKVPWTTPVLKIQKIVDDFHLDLLDSDIPNHRDIYSKVKGVGGGVGGGSHKGTELFAKFKQYRSEINVETLKIRNKIIYKGRIRDFIKVEKKCVYISGGDISEFGNSKKDLKLDVISRNRLSDSESESLEDCDEDNMLRTIDSLNNIIKEEEDRDGNEYGDVDTDEKSQENKKKINLSIDEILYTHKIQNLIDWEYLKEPDSENNKNQIHTISYKDFKKNRQQVVS